MATSKNNLVSAKSTKSTCERLVIEFYDLRKAFESVYSGTLRSHKYEETREFTIALNYGILQANQLAAQEFFSVQNFQELKVKLAQLRKQLAELLY